MDSTDPSLFGESDAKSPVSSEKVSQVSDSPEPPPRLRRADRAQVLLRPCALDELIDADHSARVVWDVVGRWDLSRFLATLKARGELPGRAATDPRVLIALWLYAYTRGVSNGRELDRLCQEHDAYRWLAGGLSLNYHTLNDFRVDHERALDDLLTQMIAALTSQGLVKVQRISTDGTRIRAGAGRNSFKTRDTLERHLAQAKAHVSAMKRQADDPNGGSARRKKAAERAARQRIERIEKAMSELKKVEAAQEARATKAAQKDKPSEDKPAKASTTDPEARQMRMPDGGTRPAYNVQLAVAVATGEGSGDVGRAIVGVDVTNAGSDVHESQPIRQQVEQRTGQKVSEQLLDGGYIGLAAIDQAAEAGVTVYAPVPKPNKEGVDPHQPKKTDSDAVAQWRVRMATADAKTIYKQRASTVETANGECKSYRGLTQALVRGINKVRCLALWSALAYNLMHFAKHLLT